jgi:hypothetical protein
MGSVFSVKEIELGWGLVVYYEIRGLVTNCSDKTNKQIGNVFVSPFVLREFVLMSVFLFCVVK